MKLVRFRHNSEIHQGQLEGEFVVSDNNKFALNDVELLAPIAPSKIIGVAENFPRGKESEKGDYEPLFFLKGLNALTISSRVRLPFEVDSWGESELGIVIKERCSHVTEAEAKNYILGYVATNDVTSTNIKGRDHHLPRSKSADGFCPMSHYIDTDYDPENKRITSYHNGELLRDGNTSDMLWSIPQIISGISQWMSLDAGDLILTGAPVRTRDRLYLKHGDTFKVSIEGLEDLETEFYSE